MAGDVGLQDQTRDWEFLNSYEVSGLKAADGNILNDYWTRINNGEILGVHFDQAYQDRANAAADRWNTWQRNEDAKAQRALEEAQKQMQGVDLNLLALQAREQELAAAGREPSQAPNNNVSASTQSFTTVVNANLVKEGDQLLARVTLPDINFRAIKSFSSGFTSALDDNFTFGGIKALLNPPKDYSFSYGLGRVFGDAYSFAAGSGMLLGGGAETGAGLLATGSGVASPVGIPLTATGVATMVAGGTVALIAGKNLIKDADDLYLNASRRSWRESEKTIGDRNPEYNPQVSFKNGEQVPWGTKGSVRPDLYKPGDSIEVKNYDLTNASNRNKLINNVSDQVNKRLENLPADTHQKVIIDVSGQNIPKEELIGIKNSISSKTNGKVLVLFEE